MALAEPAQSPPRAWRGQETVYTPPGEEHWHGVTPDDFMEHLAMFENSDDPAATTSWGQHVSDEEYDPALSDQ